MISIVIPVYNHAHTIRRVLRSIRSQIEKSHEIIIVDDGSTDDLSKQLDEASAVDGIKFTLITQSNSGAPSARNRGATVASGEYIIFWDADVVASPQFLSKLQRALTVNPSASFAYSQFRFGWKKFHCHEFDPKFLLKQNYITTTSLIRRADFPGFDESLKRFQDWDLWLTMVANKKTGVFIPEVLFRVLVGWRSGISAWLPSFAYRLPCKSAAVKKYETAREVIRQKHHLS